MAADSEHSLSLEVMPALLSVVRLPPEVGTPPWADSGSWYSVTRSADELSLVCESRVVPRDVRQEGPWRALRVDGPLDFALTGILCRIALPLADAGISIFAVSTFDTDYVLVREEALDDAVSSLRDVGMIVRTVD